MKSAILRKILFSPFYWLVQVFRMLCTAREAISIRNKSWHCATIFFQTYSAQETRDQEGGAPKERWRSAL